MMDSMIPHPLETIPPQEDALIDRVVELQIDIMKSRQDPTKRGQHPKQQALLRGVFEVVEDIPDAMRVGVFATPRKFEALVRASTGPKPNDSDPNPHALAIKLLDVPGAPGGTQDFILLDQPTFFVRDVAEYVAFFESSRKHPAAVEYFHSRAREFGHALAFNVVIASHLERQYWSEVPIAMGDGAARLTIIPELMNMSGRDPATTPDGLREALEAHFVSQQRPARFLFGAQPYVDPTTTPIEDATSIWPTRFEIVATLTLPAQDFTAPEQFEFCEHLSYTPWHCAPAHRPLGGVQRCRKRVYEESQRLRHELNGAEDREPTKCDYDGLGRFL